MQVLVTHKHIYHHSIIFLPHNRTWFISLPSVFCFHVWMYFHIYVRKLAQQVFFQTLAIIYMLKSDMISLLFWYKNLCFVHIFWFNTNKNMLYVIVMDRGWHGYSYYIWTTFNMKTVGYVINNTLMNEVWYHHQIEAKPRSDGDITPRIISVLFDINPVKI